MKKLDAIRKAKSLFMKWNLHKLTGPVSGSLANALNMGEMSDWRKQHPVKGYNDFYQETWDYNRRYLLYEAITKQEGLHQSDLDYFEFGVAGGKKTRTRLHGSLALTPLKACRKNGVHLKRVPWPMRWNRLALLM